MEHNTKSVAIRIIELYCANMSYTDMITTLKNEGYREFTFEGLRSRCKRLVAAGHMPRRRMGFTTKPHEAKSCAYNKGQLGEILSELKLLNIQLFDLYVLMKERP